MQLGSTIIVMFPGSYVGLLSSYDSKAVTCDIKILEILHHLANVYALEVPTTNQHRIYLTQSLTRPYSAIRFLAAPFF